jgi:hypothetical protein
MAAMTRTEVEALVTLLAHGGEGRYVDLGAILWNSRKPALGAGARERAKRLYAPLVAAGAVEVRGPGRVALTEKGRIASALVVSRDPWLRDLFDDGAA